MKVFIALGSQQFQLNRLLREMDALIGQGIVQELEVFAQIGFSDYLPQYYPYKCFCSRDEYSRYIGDADLMIVHGGASTIMEGLRAGKRIIVYPRKAAFHEHIDDHQLQIAQALEKKGYLLSCDGITLAEAIQKAADYDFQSYTPVKSQIPELLLGFIKGKRTDQM